MACRALNEQAGLSELMQRYSNGEDAVFEQLYRALSGRLYGFCLRLSGHVSEADDLLQETFLRLHRARTTYLAGGNALHWSFAIARSVYLDRLRYRRRHPEGLGSARDAARDARRRVDERAPPESEVQARDLLQVVALELDKMSEKNRAAYVLLREEGLSVKEAALVLGTTAAVVKQRAHRAYEQLRSALSESGWKEQSRDRTPNPDPIRVPTPPSRGVVLPRPRIG